MRANPNPSSHIPTPLVVPRVALVRLLLALILAAQSLVADPPNAFAQAARRASAAAPEGELISLDFNDVELNVVIDTISRMTGYNFIYDDRVRGRVTIVSPTEVTVDQAFAVFESVLKVKGFSLVLGPGNTYKVIPIRDVKESSIDTIKDDRPSPNRDRFVTRLVPLRFIDAEAITNTIKPLVSKDALIVAYQPTNTIIVTDSESNIRRLLQILDAIDVESFRQELAVIKIEHADAATLGDQLSEIYGASVSIQAGGATAGQRRARARQAAAAGQPAAAAGIAGSIGPTVSILPDERTNSLLVLASRQQLADIRGLIGKLDIPVRGQGRIQVYYLRHADAEELSETLNSLLGGGGGGGGGPRPSIPGAASNVVQNLRSTVTPLAEGVTITADASTNALVIQASKEAYDTLRQVIEKLDISRPQVLVEALIVEVDVTDSLDLGFNAAYRMVNGDTDILLSTGAALVPGVGMFASAIRAPSFSNPGDVDDPTKAPDQGNGKNLQLGITASKTNNDVNIVSAPHILTSDNEEAEIRIGQNIPIVTGRTQAATGATDNLAQAVSVERQDVGVTLRVTPQISEGDTLRLKIFQELTEVSETSQAGSVEEVGVTLQSRKVENTVVVNDGETVAIGGLISEVYTDNVSGVPWLADIPFLGWLFKTKSKDLRKINLIVFLTPHIVRGAEDLEQNTIRKRLELEDATDEEQRRHFPELAKIDEKRTRSRSFGAADQLVRHAERYPVERMRELEQKVAADRETRAEKARREAEAGIQRYLIQVGTFLDETDATEQLVNLIDAGYDGSLAASESGGRVVFTIQVGPFEDLWEAEQAAQTLDDAYGFESSVTLQKREAP